MNGVLDVKLNYRLVIFSFTAKPEASEVALQLSGHVLPAALIHTIDKTLSQLKLKTPSRV